MQNLQRTPLLLVFMDIVAAFGILTALLLVIFYAPVEAEMGLVQKVFYFHVASTWAGMLGFLVATISAISVLRTQNPNWDVASLAGVEIGMVFTALGIVSGSIWARPIWNTWWTWDPRLTTTLVMELIYAAYLLLRNGVDEPARRGRYAAVYAIAGFVSVPLTFLSIRIFRTIHPVLIGGIASAAGDFSMTTRMQITFFFSLAAFSFLFATLFWHRYRLGLQQKALQEIRLDQILQVEL